VRHRVEKKKGAGGEVKNESQRAIKRQPRYTQRNPPLRKNGVHGKPSLINTSRGSERVGRSRDRGGARGWRPSLQGGKSRTSPPPRRFTQLRLDLSIADENRAVEKSLRQKKGGKKKTVGQVVRQGSSPAEAPHTDSRYRRKIVEGHSVAGDLKCLFAFESARRKHC